MIIDNIRNAALYYGLGRSIEAALEYLRSRDFSEMKPGRHDIRGDECFALVSDYETAPAEEKGWEAHRRYIDVQYIASGTEKMGYAEISALRVVSEYDEDKDIIWLDGDGDFVTAHAGTFVVFFRQDAHKPGVTVENPCSVRKVVVKVLEP